MHQLVAAIDAEPNKFNNYYELGSLLTRLHDYTQAEELFLKALGLFETRGDERAVTFLKYGLGNLYYEVDQVDKAIKYYNQVEDEKMKADAYLMLAQSYVKKGQYKQAVMYGLTAHELEESDPEISQVLGDALLALGEFEQAKSTTTGSWFATRAGPTPNLTGGWWPWRLVNLTNRTWNRPSN